MSHCKLTRALESTYPLVLTSMLPPLYLLSDWKKASSLGMLIARSMGVWLIGVANRNAQFARFMDITKRFNGTGIIFADSDTSIGLRVS